MNEIKGGDPGEWLRCSPTGVVHSYSTAADTTRRRRLAGAGRVLAECRGRSGQRAQGAAAGQLPALQLTSCTAAMAGMRSLNFWVTATLTVITLAAGPVICTLAMGPSSSTSSRPPPPVPTR